MTAPRMMKLITVAALAVALAGCKETRDPGFQGWVEADMIFVSPDESGRVIKLNVREGDEVKPGELLYSVDDDLQRADLNQNNATLANAQQSYDRAASLRGTGAGTQANLDSAVSALRVAEARVVTSQTRLDRRKGFAPIAGSIQQIYFREGEMVQALVGAGIGGAVADQGQAMMVAVAAQEHHAARHHRAGIDVRHLEAQHLGVEAPGTVEISHIDDRMADLANSEGYAHGPPFLPYSFA